MAQHWTRRVLKFIGASGPLVVIKGSDEPAKKTGWVSTVGENWLRENFPLSYVGLLTELLGRQSEWHTEGRIYAISGLASPIKPVLPSRRTSSAIVRRDQKINIG